MGWNTAFAAVVASGLTNLDTDISSRLKGRVQVRKRVLV